ncbi:MAG: hypothetical protein ACNA8K_04785 [Cyclonatronaceae bacterium]
MVEQAREIIYTSDPDETAGIDGFNSRRRYAIAAGSFNGHNFRIVPPLYSRATDVVQPLVILNAPPIHFDVFDGVSYDLNRCYSGGSCDFVARYQKEVTSTEAISLQVKKDWTVSVREGITISTELGGIDRSFGENRYSVTPYIYWATNGAIVLDYAVRPEIAGPGGINTWWDDRYAQLPDHAFILPWRYDPEKGFDRYIHQ